MSAFAMPKPDLPGSRGGWAYTDAELDRIAAGGCCLATSAPKSEIRWVRETGWGFNASLDLLHEVLDEIRDAGHRVVSHGLTWRPDGSFAVNVAYERDATKRQGVLA